MSAKAAVDKLIKMGEPRNVFKNIMEKMKTGKRASTLDLLRGPRSTDLNNSSLMKDIQSLLEVASENGGFTPHEIWVFDCEDMSNPVIKELSKSYKDLPSSVLTNATNRAIKLGLPKSCVRSRGKTKVLVGGEELE